MKLRPCSSRYPGRFSPRSGRSPPMPTPTRSSSATSTTCPASMPTSTVPARSKPIKMAIADFGGSALGKPIELLTSDHQNKPDLGVQKFREWADRDGLTMMLGGANTGVSLAIAAGRQGEEDSVLRHRRRGRLAHRQGLHALHRPLRLRHDRARQRHRDDNSQRGRQDVVLPHRRLRVRDAIAGRRRARRHREWRKGLGSVRAPLATSDFASYLLQAQNSGAQVLGLANAGPDFSNSLKAANELGITKDDEAGRPARLHHRHPRARPRDGARTLSHDRMVLGSRRQDPRLRQALHGQDRARADDDPSRLLFRDDHLSQRRQGRRNDRCRQGDG